MEGHWKFLGGGGVLKAKFLEEMYENKLEFPGRGRRGGAFNKKPSVEGGGGGYGHFLELHNKIPWHFPDLEEFFSQTISWPVTTTQVFNLIL